MAEERFANLTLVGGKNTGLELSQWRLGKDTCAGYAENALLEMTFLHLTTRTGAARRDDRIEIDGKWHNAAVHAWCNNAKGSRKVPYVVVQP